MGSIWLLFLFMLILFVIGMPIAFSIGIATLAYIILGGAIPIEQFSRVLMQSLNSFPLLAIPFFILTGVIMGAGGVSKRLVRLGEAFVGGVPGGMAIVVVITCVFFGAISGSGPATVAAVGALMIPAMIKSGYGQGFSASLNAAAGGIGVLIPPSVPIIIYSVTAGTSVATMFLAGVIPGILMALALIVPSILISKKNQWKGIDRFSTKEFLSSLNEAKFALSIPVVILGGIYLGIFTPSESAAVAAVYGIFISMFVYKELKWKDLYALFKESAIISATIGILIAIASVFGQVLILEKVPQQVVDLIDSFVLGPVTFFLFLNILLLVVGVFMEAIAAIIILTPILLPTAEYFGIDPVHFGIVMIMNLAIGFVTPPVGVNLFVASGISKIRSEVIISSVTPFIIWMLAALMLVTYLPLFFY